MQINTMISYHYILIRTAAIKVALRDAGDDVEKLDLAHTVGRNVKWCRLFGT